MALPDAVVVQWHPTADWNDEIADGAWTTINLPIRHLWYRRGYERGQQRVEAGEFECTFSDPTRSFDPTKTGSATQGKGRRQFRCRVTVGGTTVTVFRGLTNGNGWKPSWRSRKDFTVTMSGTDRSTALEGIFLESVFRIVAKSLNPVWWWTLEEEGGGFFYNRGSQNTTSAVVTNADVDSPPILPYDKTASASFGTDPAGRGQFSTGVHLTPPFTITAVFNTDTPAALFSQTDIGATGEGDVIFAVDWGPALNTLTLYVDDPTNPSMQINSDQTVADKQSHIGTAYFEGSFMWIKLDLNPLKVGPLRAPPNPTPRRNVDVIGNTNDNAHPFVGRMGHLMAWNRGLSSPEFEELHSAALTAWAGLRSDQVVSKILDYCGIPAAERNVEVGAETMGASKLNASALTCLQRPANTETGLFFFDREGKAAFYARTHTGAAGTTRNTDETGTAHIGLTELEIDLDERTYYTVGRAEVSTPNPFVVEFRHANAAADGELVWEPEGGTEYVDQAAALAGATRAVGTGAPKPHFTGATSIGKASTFLELVTRDVWDTLSIVAHPAGDTETQASRILMVEHEMDGAAGTWTATLELEAV